MPASPDPQALAALRAALDDLADECARAEDDLFATLPVLGEPLPQRGLDGWTDQAVDTARALAEAAAEARQRLARYAMSSPSSDGADASTGSLPSQPRSR